MRLDWSHSLHRFLILSLLLLTGAIVLRLDASDASRVPQSLSVDDMATLTAPRSFPNIFIHQEHEGNLELRDTQDSWGSVFTYYRADRILPDLINQAVKAMSWPDRTLFWMRYKLWHLRDPWEALPLKGKLLYLKLLERHVSQAEGKSAAWDGSVFKLLVKKKDAPAHLDRHPRMEAPPGGHDHERADFLRPEIVTAKDSPALTVNEAISRARDIIKATGHAGVHFHVFLKIPPEQLRAQMSALSAALQLLNDHFFLESAYGNYANIAHPALLPWHTGRTQTVEKLVADGSPEPHIPDWNDPNNEKAANVAFRYWGMEDGLMVVSLELRGGSIPWTQLKKKNDTAGMGDVRIEEWPKRDYRPLTRELSLLTLLAQNLTEWRLAAFTVPDRVLSVDRAEALIKRRAAERGIAPNQYLPLADFAKAINGTEGIPQGFLFPFSDPSKDLSNRALVRFIDSYLDLSVEARALRNPTDHARHFQYRYWAAYREWAAAELPRERALYAQAFLTAFQTSLLTSTVRNTEEAPGPACTGALKQIAPR